MSAPSFDPTQQQQQPPFVPVTQQQDNPAHSGHGSVGPAIGVLAVIMVLGAVAVMIGRLCSGRRIMGHRQYDFEGWVETKCSSCIDGRLAPPPPPRVVGSIATNGEASATAERVEGPAGEPPHEEETSHHHHHHQHNLPEN